MGQPAEESGVREVVYKQPGGKVPTPATEVTGVDAMTINAETVIMQRSSAQSVSGERVRIEQSGIKSVNAKSVQISNAGIMSVSSERAVLQQSAVSRLRADEARLVKSRAGLVRADRAELDNSRVLLLLGKVEGDGQVGLTWPAALLLGAGFGAAVVALLSLIRLRTRR